MPIVKFDTDEQFGDALYLLHYKACGTFHVRPDRTVIVGRQQWDALKDAGLVRSENGAQRMVKRGKKTK